MKGRKVSACVIVPSKSKSARFMWRAQPARTRRRRPCLSARGGSWLRLPPAGRGGGVEHERQRATRLVSKHGFDDALLAEAHALEHGDGRRGARAGDGD